MVADAGACYAYRDSVDWNLLYILLLPMIVGMIVGGFLLGVLDDLTMKAIVGSCLLLLVIVHFTSKVLFQTYYKRSGLPLVSSTVAIEKLAISSVSSDEDSNKIRSTLLSVGIGFVCGIATILANIAAPVVTAYFLAVEMPKRELNGTRSFLFLFANSLKVPAQMALGNLNFYSDGEFIIYSIAVSLLFTIVTERYILPKVDQSAFELISWVLVFVGAIKLLWKPLQH